MPLIYRYAIEPEGKRVVYLSRRDGGAVCKEFADRSSCDRYLARRHDGVVSYRCYLDNEGILTLLKRGVFAPRARKRAKTPKDGHGRKVG